MATVEAISLIPLSVTKIIFLSFCPFSFIKKGTKGQKLSTKHYTQKTKDRATRILQKTGDELTSSGRAISSCSTSNIRRLWSRIEVTTLAMISLTWVLSVYKTCSVSRHVL